MPVDQQYSDGRLHEVSHRMLEECLQRISEGNPRGTYDLANIWMSHLFERDPVIELGVVEGLMRHAAQQGRTEAVEFLDKLWPIMRILVQTRLIRCKEMAAS